MKAIIIAAGMGTRMRPYTDNIPKCMLDFGGKTLLQRQIDAYTESGIETFSVVRGYMGHRINVENVRFFDNTDFENNNILGSLFYAEPEITGDVVIGYSDILFESSVPKRLLEDEHDISVVVDIDWTPYYVGREHHPISEAEKVRFDAHYKVTEIGKLISEKDDVDGEFIGMLKLTASGADTFKAYYQKAREEYWDKPFQRATLFQTAYLTDFLQYLTDNGVPVHCVTVERGWKEIDTAEDYNNALKYL